MLGDGQEVEDPAAAVVDAEDLERHAGAARGEQAARVVLQGELADQHPGRETGRDRARPMRRRHDAVDPVGAPVGEEAQPLGRLREAGLDVADRHRRADPDDRLVRQLRLERGEDPPLEVVRRGLDLRPHLRVGVPPACAPTRPVRARPGAHLDRAGQRVQGRAPRPRAGRARLVLVGSCQAPCGSTTICDALRDEFAKRLRRRHVADAEHEARRVLGGERLDAQQHVVVRDHVRAVVVAASHARGGLRQDRPAGLGGQARGGVRDRLGGRGRRRSARAARRRCARRRRGRRRSGGHSRARGARSRACRPGGPPSPRRRARSGSGASGSRSGKFRCTGPGRPPAAVQ